MSTTVEDWELGALIDGTLPPGRAAEVERAVDRSAALRTRLAAYERDQAALEALGDGLAVTGPAPERIDALGSALGRALDGASLRRRPSVTVPQLARYAAVLVVGAALGWGAAASQEEPSTGDAAGLVDEATEVHQAAALAPAFAREASLAAIDSLSRLFDRDLVPPDLSDWGLSLSRVDVVATDDGPAAVFAYSDPEAHLVSLVLSLNGAMLEAVGAPGDEPRVTSHDGLAVSYGGAPGVAYAVVGTVTEPRIRAIGRRVIAALGP